MAARNPLSTGHSLTRLVQLTSRKAIFEPIDDVFGKGTEPYDFPWKPLRGPVGNFIDRYVNLQCGGQMSLETRQGSRLRGEFNPQKCIFTFQKIGGENLGGANGHAFREPVKEVKLDDASDCGGNMQPSMSIFSGAIMESLQGIVQPLLRVTDRFFSTVRLYSADPVPQLLREIELVNSCRIEFSFVGTDRKFESICVGGRLASILDPNSFPYQGIKSSTELIEKLAEFEREQFIIGGNLENCCSDPCPFVFLIKIDGVAVLWKHPQHFIPKRFGMHFGALETLPTVFE